MMSAQGFHEQEIAGQVVKLDRGYPLVRLSDGSLVRCEYATELIKSGELRAVIGDMVEVSLPDSHDKCRICAICPRRTQLVRRDPAERTQAQVLAANFDVVLVAQPVTDVNDKRLERELVLAFETGARVAVVLTKADLACNEEAVIAVRERVRRLAGSDVALQVVSQKDANSLEALRSLIQPEEMAVFIGKSGVGKSSLINMLVGYEVQETGAVRLTDGRGRHTTVSREIIDLPDGRRVIDMPGVRGLGMWETDKGVGAAFVDIEQHARNCRFRDCCHGDEPGCAVRKAVEAGMLASERLVSYRLLKQETDNTRQRHIEATRKKRDYSIRTSGRKRTRR